MNAFMLSEDDRRKRRRIWLFGSAALLALAAAAAAWAVRCVPPDISERTVSALRAAGLDPRVGVAVEGRTVVLSGEAPDAYTRARMRAIAGSVRGVREVRDRLTVAPLPVQSLPPAAPALQAAATPLPPPAAAADPPPLSNPPEPIRAALGQAPSDRPSVAAESPPARSEPEPDPPPPPPARLQLPLLHFAFGGTRLTPESEQRLKQIVAALSRRPEVRVELAGHTDSVGPKSLNRRLSLQRARAVADRLAAAGIDGARLQTSGHCDRRPLMDNHTRKGRAMNRRVELILIQ